jgi:hypothetical protein
MAGFDERVKSVKWLKPALVRLVCIFSITSIVAKPDFFEHTVLVIGLGQG